MFVSTLKKELTTTLSSPSFHIQTSTQFNKSTGFIFLYFSVIEDKFNPDGNDNDETFERSEMALSRRQDVTVSYVSRC